MSAIAYWRERLYNKFPLYNMSYVESDFVRIDEGQFPKVWPMAIAKQTLYNDYLSWFDKVFSVPYRGVPYYEDNPEALPKADDQFTFFTNMGPLLYIVGQAQQDRQYLVDMPETSGGVTILVRRRIKFIRFCPFEAHVATFEQRIGMKIVSPNARFDPKSDALIRAVIDAVKRKNARIEAAVTSSKLAKGT